MQQPKQFLYDAFIHLGNVLGQAYKNGDGGDKDKEDIDNPFC